MVNESEAVLESTNITKTGIDKESLVKWRRILHMHPEIAGKERETAAYVAKKLRQMGLKVEENIAGFGLMAVLPGDPQKNCVALRADMDALPIDEINNTVYKSQRPGWMHACGHDAHMAMVLGAARTLTQNPPGGALKFIFQPSEEKPPGGAREMVWAGVLQNPDVDAIFATHITNAYPVGTVGLFDGAVMAVADDFKLTICGRGGHGASPHQTIDTIAVTAQAIEAMQNIHSRRIDPTEPVVLTIGTIHGGTAQNIIPDRVEMTGTVRCSRTQTRDRVLEYMHEVLAGVTYAWGAHYELNYIYGYPPVINNPRLLHLVEEVARDIPGLTIKNMAKPLMAGEDFSYFSAAVPAVFFLTGSGSEKHHQAWHTCDFDIDENALTFGATLLAQTVTRVASQNKVDYRQEGNS
ncbi:MAG: amidohydrolase [Clostridiales bacterium]|nr:amidohydrolase [Clostridiales bacterium]MDR2712036.1 amidohydrolase [Clostridiales bacterium]